MKVNEQGERWKRRRHADDVHRAIRAVHRIDWVAVERFIDAAARELVRRMNTYLRQAR